MEQRLLLVFGACLVVSAAGCGQRPDAERLQGAWQSPPDRPTVHITFTGSAFALTLPGEKIPAPLNPVQLPPEEFKGTVRLNPDAEPKELDLVFLEGRVEKTHRGIYQLDGEGLSICFNEVPGGPRPTAFTAGDRISLWWLERTK